MLVKKLLATSALFAFLLGCSVVQVGGNANIYFPIDDGNKWTYEVESNRELNKYYKTWELKELSDRSYHWVTDEISIASSSIDNATDPFIDTVSSIVDSALYWRGANLIIPTQRNDLNSVPKTHLKTPYFEFENCVLIKGQTNKENVHYEIWFAQGIGPVLIDEYKGDVLSRKFTLVDFYSSK
jgi:hypothetical protein